MQLFDQNKNELVAELDRRVKVPNARAELLQGAEKAVNGDRNAQYGDPIADFRRTADMWTAYLTGVRERAGSVTLSPYDVAAMMGLLKISRIAWSPEKEDSWMDLAGYAACGWDCAAALESDE